MRVRNHYTSTGVAVCYI